MSDDPSFKQLVTAPDYKTLVTNAMQGGGSRTMILRRAMQACRDMANPKEIEAEITRQQEAARPDCATIYISWSDTDLSFGFHCKCGARPCGGGTYCNYIKCPKCDRIYEMPLALKVKEVAKPPYNIEPPKMMEGE